MWIISLFNISGKPNIVAIRVIYYVVNGALAYDVESSILSLQRAICLRSEVRVISSMLILQTHCGILFCYKKRVLTAILS